MRTTKRLWSIAIAMLVWTFAHNADAQNAYPRLQPGRHVYGLPDGYVNPTVGTPGAIRLEAELRTLHHPFYVIFVDRVPGSGDAATAEAARLVDSVAAEWRANQPDLYPPEASLFLQVTAPRKYRMSPGSRWATQLGLERERLTQFGTDHFVPYMRRTPEDPVTGILETTHAIDAYVFEATDPEILRQRREAEARRAEARRLAAEARAAERRADENAQARRSLGNEIFRATTLLASEGRYLPTGLGTHRVAVENARLIQGRSDVNTEAISDGKASLQRANDTLEAFINARKSEESNAAWLAALKWSTLVLLALGVLWLIGKRFKTVRLLREELAEKIEKWQPKVGNALERYVTFDTQRSALQALALKMGRTGTLYRDVTEQVDSIIVLIEAMRMHLLTCLSRGAKGGFFNADPLREAIKAVDEIFTFDTGVLDQARLFHPQTVQKAINPATIESELASQFKAAMSGWDDLREAYEAGSRDPRADLPLADLDSLRTRATKAKVPHEWLKGHPLAQRNSEVTYTDLIALRSSDPVDYCETVDRLKAQAAEVTAAVDEIIALVQPVFGQSLSVDVPEGTVFDQNDSPTPHVEAAMKGEGELAGMLKALTPKAELQGKVKAILRERTKATEKAELIRFAIDKADEALAEARTQQTLVHNESARIASRLAGVRKVHADGDIDVVHVNAATHAKELGDAHLQTAQLALEGKQHVSARRRALEARKHLETASEQYTQAEASFRALDQAVTDATASIAQATDSLANAKAAKAKASQRVDVAGKVHANIREAKRYVDDGTASIGNGETSLTKARTAVNEKRHVQAKSLADTAIANFRKASTAFEDANRWCNEHDQKKAEYEAFVANAGRYRSSAESRIRGAGRSVKLALFQGSSGSNAMDYAAGLAAAMAARDGWERDARRAEQEHADDVRRAEEARRQAEAEAAAAARRRREEEEESSRRAAAAAGSYNNSPNYGSDNSGGGGYDFGGGDTSSGGGDFGGGDTSSGGGDY